MLALYFYCFHLAPFSVAEAHPGHCRVVSGRGSLGSSRLPWLPRLPLFFMTVAVRGVLVRYFVECSSSRICPLCFSRLDQSCSVLEEDHRGKVLFDTIAAQAPRSWTPPRGRLRQRFAGLSAAKSLPLTFPRRRSF